jgi:hypothetical protein
MNTEKIKLGGEAAEKRHVEGVINRVFHSEEYYSREIGEISKLSAGQVWYLGSIFAKHAKRLLVKEKLQHYNRMSDYKQLLADDEKMRKLMIFSSWKRSERAIKFLQFLKKINSGKPRKSAKKIEKNRLLPVLIRN